MPPKKQPEEEALEPTTGDGGARDEEVSEAIIAVENLADAIDLGEDQAKIVGNTTDWLVELYKRRPKPWSQLSQSEQRDLVAALEHNAKELVRLVVEAIARDGRPAIRALLESYTEKDGIKATLKIKTFTEEESLAAVVGLHKAQGKHVLITVASADDFAQDTGEDRTEPDQHQMGFEAGTDEHEDGENEDLTAAAGIVRTGDKIEIEPYGSCEVAVNIKTMMVEITFEGSHGLETIDWRAATPEELAAERDRTADFTDEVASEVAPAE